MITAFIFNLILTLFTANANLPIITNQGWELMSLPKEASREIVAADKAAVLSPDGRYLLFDKRADIVQPIASITKLMTALVFLETKPDWESTYTITTADMISGGRLNLFPGDTVSLKDLFLTSLVASDNGATMALVNASGLSQEEFIARMNQKALELRLLNTSFSDPIGLSEKNVSTAREVALLAHSAFQLNEISEAIKLKEYQFTTQKDKEILIESTDHLLYDSSQNDFKSLGGKTGYTDLAGYCFVGRFEGKQGEQLIASVLNSAGLNERFRESKTIIGWVLENYFKNIK
ncbi:MAG TPA: serine hydrolase [bacterium]|jgi:D-alanyl-D-alanine carboxypeptidase|nr:serine hydrolase [bacterium]HQC49949.1 serine hydrolase [bacterium]